MNATRITAQIGYQLARPVPIDLEGRFPGMGVHNIVRVAVFTDGVPDAATIVATTDTGRTLTAGHPRNPEDDPRLLVMFAEHIRDANRRTAFADFKPVPAVITLDGKSVEHLGVTRDEKPRQTTGPVHMCDHPGSAHDCVCQIGTGHSWRAHDFNCALYIPRVKA